MKQWILIWLLAAANICHGQLYFPPTTGSTWDTLAPETQGWCKERIDSLSSYLAARNTDAFIVLVDGKIVIEKYFGTFTADSAHYWASASKSLTATLTGIAQERGMLQISDTVSDWLGNGWTVAPAAKERAITIRHLLTMTSGLNDTVSAPCDNEDTSAACLRYLADAGTRWAYHTGAYRKLLTVISAASGLGINTFTNNYVGATTGITGLWYNGMFYSKPRSMARFGLLALNKGVWGADTVLHDTAYFQAMVNTSQPYNPAYGYLWWLNGKSSYLSPGSQYVFSGTLVPNAPADMYCALGKNDQKIYVVPSRKMVVIRTGESAYGVAMAFSPFDNELWGKIDSLGYHCPTAVATTTKALPFVYPNPAHHQAVIAYAGQQFALTLYDAMGRVALHRANCTDTTTIDCHSLAPGLYVAELISPQGDVQRMKVVVER